MHACLTSVIERKASLRSCSHLTLPSGPLSFDLVHFPLCYAAITHSHPPLTHTLTFTLGIPLTVTHSLTLILPPKLTLTHPSSNPHTHSHPPSLQESAVVFIEGADHSSLSISPEDFARYTVCMNLCRQHELHPLHPLHFHWSVSLTTYCNLIKRKTANGVFIILFVLSLVLL